MGYNGTKRQEAIMPRRLDPADMLGKTFNKLTVTAFVGLKNGRTVWRCRCECGNEITVLGGNLRCGQPLSCGCLHAGAEAEFVGKRFGKLVVVAGDGLDERGSRRWLCQCACGNTVTKRTADLRNGHAASCGCANRAKGKARRNYTGFEDISGGYWAAICGNARKRGLSFSITIRQAWQLFLAQNRRCALSGLELSLAQSGFPDRTHNQTASLDRIDSAKGYTLDNVQWIHKKFQQMKKNLSDKKFVQLCALVARHHSRPKSEANSGDEATLFE